MSYEVGKFYNVPTVRGKIYYMERDWPVIGPKHEDAEFINFPYQHYHVDWRFVPKVDTQRIRYSVYGVPLHEAGQNGPNNGPLPSPVLRRRKCQRQWWTYPLGSAQWLPKLNAAYSECTMKNMVCPHRGISLVGAPCEGDVVTCPGHGLRWNVKTGALVTDAREPQGERSDG